MAVSSPAEDIQTRLITGTGCPGSDPTGSGAWPCWISVLPEDPDDCLAVVDSGGGQPIYNTGNTVYNPIVDVYVRSTGYSTGYTKMRGVMSNMENANSFTYNSMVYLGVTLVQEPVFLGYDSKNRAVFRASFNVPRQ